MFCPKREREHLKASIIIPCRDERHYIRQTLQHILNVSAGVPYEIIVVDDGSRDGCCDFLRQGKCSLAYTGENYVPDIQLLTTTGTGVARARNFGAGWATARYLVFCDAHIIVSPGWLEGLITCLEKGEADAVCPTMIFTRPLHYTFYGGTWDENFSWVGITDRPPGLREIPFAPSGCLAIRKDVFKQVGGFEEDFQVWGYDDAELSLKLWLFGYRVAVNPFVRIFHINRYSPKYQRGRHLLHNLLLLAILHFSAPRLARKIESFKHYPDFSPSLYKELWEKHYLRRLSYFQRRLFSDDWFMQKFGISL